VSFYFLCGEVFVSSSRVQVFAPVKEFRLEDAGKETSNAFFSFFIMEHYLLILQKERERERQIDTSRHAGGLWPAAVLRRAHAALTWRSAATSRPIRESDDNVVSSGDRRRDTSNSLTCETSVIWPDVSASA